MPLHPTLLPPLGEMSIKCLILCALFINAWLCKICIISLAADVVLIFFLNHSNKFQRDLVVYLFILLTHSFPSMTSFLKCVFACFLLFQKIAFIKGRSITVFPGSFLAACVWPSPIGWPLLQRTAYTTRE